MMDQWGGGGSKNRSVANDMILKLLQGVKGSI